MSHLHFESVDEAWICSLDLENGCRGLPRNSNLQVFEITHSRLDLVSFHLFAPIGCGLWFLRDYGAYTHGARCYINDYPDFIVEFRRHLKWLKIPFKSEHSSRCFGLLPHFYGNEFRCARPNHLLDHRYLSFSAPVRYSSRMREMLNAQAVEFAGALVREVSEDEILWHHQYPVPWQESLLNQPPLTMDDKVMGKIEEGLRQLLMSCTDAATLTEKLNVSSWFSGAIEIRVPEAGLLANKDAQCVEGIIAICRLRVELLLLLRWPHMIEYAIGQLQTSAATDQLFGEELRVIWREFRSVHLNPFEPTLS